MSLIDRSRSPTAGTHPPTFDHGSLIYPNLSHRFNLRVTSLIWAINQNVWWLPLLSRYCVYPGRPLIPPTPSPAHTHIRQTHTHCLETAFKRLHTPTQTLKCLIYKVGGFLQTSVTLFALHISREAFIQSAGALCVFTLGEHCLSFNSQQCRAILSSFFFKSFAHLLLITDSLAPLGPESASSMSVLSRSSFGHGSVFDNSRSLILQNSQHQ